MTGPKVTVIGAGSYFFGKAVIHKMATSPVMAGGTLALVDTDVLDALDCDCIAVHWDTCTNAFTEPARWHPYDFGGRLPALVMAPEKYETRPDGSVVLGNMTMLANSSRG